MLVRNSRYLKKLNKPFTFSLRHFAYIHNFHHPPLFYVNDIRYVNDYDISEYEPLVQAFLGRRWITKREVYPKIEVLPNMDDYKDSLYLQKLVPIDRLLTENHMVRMYEYDTVNSQYIMTIFCEEYEKNLYEAYAKKILMNGQVVGWGEYNQFVNLKRKADEIFDIFYNGEKLTSFERDLERKYLTLKLDKLAKYNKSKSMRNKVRWTLSDINRFQEQEDYRMTDMEYLSKPRPIYSKFNMDESAKHLYTYMDIQKYSRIRKTWVWLTEMSHFERSRQRNQLQARILLQKLFQYPD